MARLIEKAQNDTSIKVIFIHGGKTYTSGNDLSVFLKYADATKEEQRDVSSTSTELYMTSNLIQLKNSVKPIVALVRGVCIGIGFTMTSHFDFIYCAPNAKFSAPFMASAQSPEGGSSYTFAKQFGLRRANEILMLDKPITAHEAVKFGYANGVIDDLGDSEWPDLAKIPTLGKLLATDYKTLVNCKSLLNKARDNEKLETVIFDEAKTLVNIWSDEDFPPKIMTYMMNL